MVYFTWPVEDSCMWFAQEDSWTNKLIYFYQILFPCTFSKDFEFNFFHTNVKKNLMTHAWLHNSLNQTHFNINLHHTSCSDESAVEMRLEDNQLNTLRDVAAAICNRTESDGG